MFLTDRFPGTNPIAFLPELAPEDKLVHKGTFSPDLNEYYYTISNKDFSQFTVKVITKVNGQWSASTDAFFNSKYDDHGMSFSPNGNTLFFSSTRPVPVEGVPDTWHIWKSEKIKGKWSDPEFIDIPNLKNKLISHPSVTNSGTLYFHASNLDYSDMDIYSSKLINGKYENAEKLSIPDYSEVNKCTPHVSPKEDYLIFASIGNQLDLMISFNDGSGAWKETKAFDAKINTNGQGNPYITPDEKFLFFTTGKDSENWSVKWVDISPELKK
ncbi:hypothetical protein GTQ40_15400 [Flavobacteriaceae bacterium R38]|nr:hypothetical protein [Flavobacteriaceae bacterium R38]